MSTIKPSGKQIQFGEREISNFYKLIKMFKAREGSLPKVKGFEFGYMSMPKYIVGGDHITFMNFEKRYVLPDQIQKAIDMQKFDVAQELKKLYSRGGFYLIDVENHNDTDAIFAVTLHNAFLASAIYEIKDFGQISPRVFEILNTRFYEAAELNKTISGIYTEVNSDGVVKFINQGNPFPVVFSNEYNRFVDLADISGNEFKTSEPIGFKPSINHIDAAKHKDAPFGYKEPYFVNEIKLEGSGDIMLFFTDGLSDHYRKKDSDTEELFFPGNLEEILRSEKNKSAKDISTAIKNAILEYNPVQHDDITYVVIKKK